MKDISRQEIERLYIQERKRRPEIAKEFGVSNSCIQYWISKYRLKRARLDRKRPLSRHSLNERYFQYIDSEEKAYWLGFIAADGCIRTDKGGCRLSIELSVKDRGHLEKFARAIDYTGPIHYDIEHKQKYKNENKIILCDRLGVSSKVMVMDLVKHGITPRKSKTLKSPKIKNKLIRHWIRGYFDGDGSVRMDKQNNTRGEIFSGSRSVIYFIGQHILPDAKIQEKQNGFAVGWGGNNVSKRIYNYLYKARTICLSRKLAIFERLDVL